MPNIRDLCDPEFGPIKARLARAYLEHKGDLGMLLTDDAEIIALVDEITLRLAARSGRRGVYRTLPERGSQTTWQASPSTAEGVPNETESFVAANGGGVTLRVFPTILVAFYPSPSCVSPMWRTAWALGALSLAPGAIFVGRLPAHR